MPQAINLSDEDIRYAENILLPAGKAFDDERRAFIRNLNTIDLQAVPGSGKTTALLAKLIILERKLPLIDGSGILVLSHTNAAIDEIKAKIQKHCPKLFTYPNFVGTIQSFTDEFLAIPFYISKFRQKPSRIDKQIYEEAVSKHFSSNLKGFTIQEQKNARYYLIGNNYKFSYRLAYQNNAICLVSSVNGDELNISKPKKGSAWQDFSVVEKSKIKEWLIKFKLSIMQKEGILHFDDAFFLAGLYLSKIPTIKTLLQKRFRFVFVDEMQDMDVHQYNLLENIFYENGNSTSKYQRIGDKNQAIYNSVKANEVWTDRLEILRLSGSQRLSKAVADVVKKFALHTDADFDIVGLNQSVIKPHLLVFEDASIENIIPCYAQIVRANNLADSDKSIKVVCWNTDWKEDDASRQDIKKLRLEDYFSGFKKEKSKPRRDYGCLKSYLLYYDKNKKSLSPLYKNILNSLFKILRLENIYASGNRPYTRKSLFDYIKETDIQKYDELNLNLYNWSIGVIQDNTDVIWIHIKAYVPNFLGVFSKTITPASSSFINNDIDTQEEETEQSHATNNFIDAELEIEVTSVHSVKGQTHAATLYLESCYQGKHESERLTNQFLGTPFKESKVHHKSSVKMAYVGFSRPTELLCIAIHKDRFDKYLSGINREEWEIKEVTS